MKRGDVVVAVFPREFGKPRPAVVVQSDLVAGHPTVYLAPISTTLRDTSLFRVRIEPHPSNGLSETSEVQADKIHPIPRARVARVIGSVATAEMKAVERSMALMFALSPRP